MMQREFKFACSSEDWVVVPIIISVCILLMLGRGTGAGGDAGAKVHS